MATYSQGLRKGLPRTAGGPAWPDVEGAVLGVAQEAAPAAPAASAESLASSAPAAASVTQEAHAAVQSEPAVQVAAADAASLAGATVAAPLEAPVAPATGTAASAAEASSVVTEEVALRQGLPRTVGGDPWPPAGTATVTRAAGAAAASVAVAASATESTAPVATPAESAAPASAAPVAAASSTGAVAAVTVAGATAAGFETVTEEVALRQGLPRTVGGDPWPPAGTATVTRAIAQAPAATEPVAEEAAAVVAPAAAAVAVESATTETPAEEAAIRARHAAEEQAAATPQKAEAPAAAAPAAAGTPAAAPAPVKPAKPAREPIMVGNRTLAKWVGLIALWGGGAVVAAGIIVLAARGLTTLPGVPEFLERYPGEYHLPEFVDPGFPAWARWTHFLNFFLMVLIIRSGLLVRRQQKPDAFFTPKKGGKKISIYLWLHTSIDLLWLLNGLVFVVLLFASGHWARIVPTSWEVFPNALSAGIQYLTLEWPVEDGWVNYNSLQQLMYFTVVFIAAPLAAITGVRMSEWWPEKAEKLNKLYPAPVARAIHYPTMLFFVLFIIIHVFLVFSTGMLKNLNHMFAGTPEISWVGFWWFAGAVLVTAAVTWAARPLVLAPIANLFGRVSER